jgi:hypothetical protein
MEMNILEDILVNSQDIPPDVAKVINKNFSKLMNGYDVYVKMEPKKKYSIKAKIVKISKAKPKVII